MNEKAKTVHEVAKLTGITARTLHYYDEIGLLKPSIITEAKYRQYTDDDLTRLQEILFFREVGFALKEIKELLDSPHYVRSEALERILSAQPPTVPLLSQNTSLCLLRSLFLWISSARTSQCRCCSHSCIPGACSCSLHSARQCPYLPRTARFRRRNRQNSVRMPHGCRRHSMHSFPLLRQVPRRNGSLYI